MTLLPEKWEQTYLGELAALKTGPFGSALHKSDYMTGGIPVVNPTHIVGGKIVPASLTTVAPETAERLSEFRLQYGDVVLGRRGEMGRCAVVGEAEHGWLCGTGSLIVRPGTALDPHYLQRFLSSPAVVSRLEEVSVGSTMVNLNQRILLELEVPIPPLAEQKRIADKLDTVLARVDTCRERLDRVPAILKRFRQAVLAAATSGKLTEEWRNERGDYPWMSTTLGACGAVSGGLTKNANRQSHELKKHYLRVANVYANRLDLSDVAEIGLTQAEHAKTKLRPSDLLIVEGNGSLDQIGRVALWNGELDDCVHQNHLIRWRSSGPISKFVLFWLLSPQGRDDLMHLASTTTGLHTLSISKVSALPMQLPPSQEQDEIVHCIETLFAYADRLEGRYTAAHAQVERLTPALLAKAFRGELVPQDPNEEPALVPLCIWVKRPTPAACGISQDILIQLIALIALLPHWH